MPKGSIAFQVLPGIKNQKEALFIIDAVIALVKQSGVTYEVGPMETTMEGELEVLFDIVKKSQYLCIQKGAASVFTNVKILYNPKGVMTIAEKVQKHR